MTIIVYLSFAFGISELILMLVKRSKTGSIKTRADKGSIILIWISIVLGFAVGFFLSGTEGILSAGTGVALIVTGLIIRWIAILQLGRSFTVDVAITDAASLKTDGIYRIIRHPSYTGLLLIIAGFSIAMNSTYSCISLFVPVFLTISYRISVEEKLMLCEFGDDYNKYKVKTKKIIPGIY